MQNLRKWKQLWVFLLAGVAFYFVIRYLFAAVLPFVLAYILVRMLLPVTTWIQKKCRINRGISAAILLFLFTGGICIGLWWLIMKLFGQMSEIFELMPDYAQKADGMFMKCCLHIENTFGIKVEYVKPYLLGQFYQSLERLRDSFTAGVMSYCYAYAKSIVRVVAIIFVVIVSAITTIKDYDKIRKRLGKSLFFKEIKEMKDKLFYAGAVYIRAQLILLVLTTIICVVLLFVLRIKHALLIGVLIGLMDMLPFLGTGAVFVPWSILEVFRGNLVSAATLASAYLICSFVREFLEPKMIGKKLGIPAVYIIVSIYAGIVLYGIAGIILGPLHIVLSIETAKKWLEDHKEADE